MHSFEAQLTPVAIPAGRVTLEGILHQPSEAHALVLFAHGGGSSRHSLGNQRLADALHDVGLATLSFDLLPESGGGGFDAPLRNDVRLLAGRLRTVTAWCGQQRELRDFPMGYFGCDNGGAAALLAATDLRTGIRAIVTLSARESMDDPEVLAVKSPTMLVVGGNDETITALNLEAWARLRGEKAIEIIPGASHRFDEPGALDNVAAVAARWFTEHLRKNPMT